MRKNRTRAAEADGGPLLATSFTIGLKPPDNAEFQPSPNIVSSEYATRYLEQLGVSPNRTTLDMVAQHIPLTEKCIKTTIRAKGHVADEIQITVPSVNHHPRVPQVIGPQAVLQLGLSNAEAGALGTEAQPLGTRRGSCEGSITYNGQTALQETKEMPGMQFKHLAAKYLHPFHLDTNLARQQLEALRPPMRRTTALAPMASSTKPPRRAGAQPPSSLPPGGNVDAGGGDGGSWDADVLRQEIKEELVQEWVITPEVVLTLLAQLEAALVDWQRAQAAETLKGRLTQEEFQYTLELLCDDHTVHWLITLLNFLHEEYVRGSPNFPHKLEAKMATQLQHQRSSLSGINRTNSSLSSRPRITSGTSTSPLAMRSAANATALQSSKLQLFEKYDLGYQVWVKDKVQAMKAAREAAAREKASAAAANANTHAGTTLGAAPHSQPSRQGSPANQHSHSSHSHDSHSHNSHKLRHQPGHSEHQPQGPGAPAHPSPHPQNVPGAEGGPSQGQGAGKAHRGDRPSGICFALEIDVQDAEGRHSPNSHHASPLGGTHSRPHSRTGSKAGSRPPSASPSLTDLSNPHTPHRRSSRPTPSPTHDYPHSPSRARLDAPSRAAARSLAMLPSMQLLAAAAANGTHRVSSLGPGDVEELQRARLLVLQQDFSALVKAQREHRAGMFFVLPIYLVAARLVTATAFPALLALWTQTAEGAAALELMDSALVHLFDPHGYLAKALSMLQSTPSAVSLMSRHPHQSHGPERTHFHDVSPVMREAMAAPVSSEARRLLLRGRVDRADRVRRAQVGRVGPAADAARAAARTESGAAAAQGPLRTRLGTSQREALYREAHAALLVDPPLPLHLPSPQPADTTTRAEWVQWQR